MAGHREQGAAPVPGNAGNAEEAAMDIYLKSRGLYRKKIAKDGSCLFRAVAEQVLHSQARHLEMRQSCIKYLRENRTRFEAFIEGSFEEYLKRLENPQEWVGQVEISALSLMFSKDFIIYQEPNTSPAPVTDNGFSDKIMLCFSNGNHYDILYPLGFAKNAAMCQSIIYELLYEKVFGHCVTKHVSKADTFDSKTEEVFVSGASGSDGEYEVAGINNSSFVDMNGFKSQKDGKFSQRKSATPSVPLSVLRSLNPGVYRNVEYEVWMKSQKDQQKLDFSIAAGMQYSVGDKCQVRLEPGGVFYNAYIEEAGAENRPAVVFVQELGQKYIVQWKNVKPISLNSDTDGWNTVTGKKVKKTSASGTGYIDKDYRGQLNYSKAVKAQPPSRLQQTSTNKQQGMSSDQATLNENKGRSRTPPKVPGRKLEQREESSYFKRENIHFGLSPEELMEKKVIEESKFVYKIQKKSINTFSAVSASVTAGNTSAKSSVSLSFTNIPVLSNEKSSRRKSEAEDQKNKVSKLVQPPNANEKLSEERTKPLTTSKSVLHDVTVLPTPAEQQTPTTVPSEPAVVSSWSGISAEMPTLPRAGSDSIVQPQVTSAQFAPLPVSIPAVNQPLLPMPQTLSAYQDPLYPGFPVNEKGERSTAPPPYSLCKNGDDLPTDKSILHFFYNLGIKAYTCPMWPPHLYLHPLHQAYLNICTMYPNVQFYPQSPWVQEAAVNQSKVDPTVVSHQDVQKNEKQSEQPPSVVQPLPVQVPRTGEEMPTQPNSTEEKQEFQAQGSAFEDQPSKKAMLPQPSFGQGSFMGPLPIASPFFPPVWYGYPYQGFIENPMVQRNVFINPQDASLTENNSTGTPLENNAVQAAINQSPFVSEQVGPQLPAAVVAGESGLNTTVLKEEPTSDMARKEEQKVPAKQTGDQTAPLVLTVIPEVKKSTQKELASVPVVMPPEERPLRAREESSEDEKEVSSMLSSGKSKNFYNQSYGSRKPRNDRSYQTNRGGYQYNRTEESWRGQRGREDGSLRNFRGRPNRRRQFGDSSKSQHE